MGMMVTAQEKRGRIMRVGWRGRKQGLGAGRVMRMARVSKEGRMKTVSEGTP